MGLKGLQILVIEHAPDVLDVLTLLLRMEGADVKGAASGPAVTLGLEAGADFVFAKPCQWPRVVTYLDELSMVPAA